MRYIKSMNNSQKSICNDKVNITVVVSRKELDAIDAFLKPFCGSRGPFIKQIVLEKIGYKEKEAAE